jgi:cyanophycin synthetase
MTAEILTELPTSSHRPASFAAWRRQIDREQVAPVVAIAGSRGKTSVARALESIFRAEGLRLATWTNRGVEIEGQGQRGELGPWARVHTRLKAGALDVAIRELHWATLQAVGHSGANYPVVAVSNLCGNSDACLATPESLLARKALARAKASVTDLGRLILNANDLDLSEHLDFAAPERYLVARSPEAPVMRRHLLRGGDACYLDGLNLVVDEGGVSFPVVDIQDLAWVHDGTISFAVQNALMAAAIARACGISTTVIARGLADHVARPELMPGSFNIFEAGAATIVVDRPMPSWFLRASLRAAGSLGSGRLIRVVGAMRDVPTDDLMEVGRLLGRQSGVVVVHGDWAADRSQLLRQGASANEVPPLFVQAPDERNAILQSLEMLRPEDVMLILAENPQSAVRLVTSRVRRRFADSGASAGVA